MIKKPNEMKFSEKKLIMIISGTPGVGKTTLGCSASDKVLVIDTDDGLCRVRPEHRKDASVCTTYEEILADIKAAEGIYDTIVIDTAGALIDYLKDWAIRNDPKASKSSGGISLQGFGVVKQEFLRLSAELKKKFNVIYLFHEKRENNGDDIFYSIVCEGSARELVYQPADLAAHCFIQNGKRYLGFSPTDQYFAKSAYGISGLVEVTDLSNGGKNEFIHNLFGLVRENLQKEVQELEPKKAAYEKAMDWGKTVVATIKEPKDVAPALKEIDGMEHALTSKKELLAMVKKVCIDLGITYNKATKEYVYANK